MSLLRRGCDAGSEVFKLIDEVDFFVIGYNDVFGEGVVVEVISIGHEYCTSHAICLMTDD